MRSRNISWEIILAGLAFIGIGIYLFNQDSSIESTIPTTSSPSKVPQAPSSSDLPETIVLDLQDLKSLENLKNLQDVEEIKKLDSVFNNIEKIFEEKMQNNGGHEKLDQSLQHLEEELQKIKETDFNVKLQDQKVFIEKDYEVDEAQWTEVSSGVYVFRETFTSDDLQSMNFDVGFGNVNIVGANEQQGEIIIRATGNIEDPAIFSKELVIKKDLTSSNGSFSMSTVKNSNISNRINLEATLTIPVDTEVDINTSGGHIKASNLQNNQHFKTSGGHIELEGIEGETIAETSGGHITGDNILGNTSLSTAGGHIKINSSNGSLSAKTGGGHIEIQDASGSVNAKTSGGNITSSIQQVNGPLKFNTSAGNISLSLPQNIEADLDVSGSSVSLADAFNFTGTQNNGRISGSINGGGHSVVVNCGYGNVTISIYK